MRFNRLPTGVWFPLPRQLETVLAAAFEIGRLSSDAFDVGVGDLVAAWGFGPAAGRIDRAAIAAAGRMRAPARLTVEYDHQNHRARKLAETTLDLSGLAKGYGVDELASKLNEHGVKHYLVSIDGEIRAAGGTSERPWQVALEAPLAGARIRAGIVEMHDGALATSGDYRHVRSLDGVPYSHTMNPWKRRPLQSAVAAVTVGAPTCMEADAWATAFMVMGPDRGGALAAQLRLETLFAMAD
jgi:thiamine biosynthesis lipoprotein